MSDAPKPDKEIIAVIDADELAYICAAACEERMVVLKNTTNGFEQPFKNKTAIKKLFEGIKVPEGFFTQEEKQIAEPKSHAFAEIKRKINKFKEVLGADKVELYISGDDNFRLSLPLPVRYKGQREDSTSPLLLDECKEYVRQYQGAITTKGVEADDLLVQRMWDGYTNKQKIIAVTQDKDAAGNNGWLFNPEKHEKPIFIDGFGDVYVDESVKTFTVKGVGRKWLYWQVLMGDMADHYNPKDIAAQLGIKLKRFGDKTAFPLFSELKNDKECLQFVVDKFKEWYGTEPITYKCWEGKEHTVTYLDILQLYWDTARMRRWEGDVVKVVDVLKKLGVEVE